MVDSRKRARVEESSSSSSSSNGGGGGGDRISGLSDEILHQIFSFLPTREVVQTCVFSKRWRNLWCSVPWLDFDEETFLASSSSSSSSSNSSSRTDQLHAAAAAGSSFSTFVNYAMLLRDGSSNIQNLRLSCSSDNTSSSNHVFQYIVAALKHNLQLLDLKILQHHHPAADNLLPSSLFTCQSLTCLKLNNVVLPTYNYSSNIWLKTLHLISVKFPGNKLSTESLFSNSQNLETLTIHNCNFEHLESLFIRVRQLKNLIIIQDVAPSSTSNIPSPFTIVLAPNLVSLKLHVEIGSSWWVMCENLLVEADMNFKRPPLSKDISSGFRNSLLSELKSAKAITLSGSCLEVIGKKRIPSAVEVASFHNLKLMKLTTCFEECEVHGIAHLLKRSPNIETLVIEYNSESSYKKRLPVIVKKLPSECTLHHLKTIQMRGFGGRKNEVKLLTFLLENAKSLKKMIVEEASI